MRWSSHFQTEFHVLRPTLCYQRFLSFVYGSFTLFALLFQYTSTTEKFCNSIRYLGYSAFNRLYLRNRYCFLFLRVLRCFSSPGIPSYNYVFIIRYQHFLLVGSPIRISTDLCVLTAPRSISLLVASFIGCWCQGILCALFVSLPYIFLILGKQFLLFILESILTLVIKFLNLRFFILCDKYYSIFKDL